MNLLCIGCNFHKTGVELRERLAFDGDKLPRALAALCSAHDCEAVILSTCNRVELYLVGEEKLATEEVVAFLATFHGVSGAEIAPQLYSHRDGAAVQHLFRVAASLDSLIVGEAQIAGQVKKAYELAQEHDSAGPLLNGLFQQARVVARRVRTETGISRGHVSVSSAAVDYVRQVFDHFGDKTILVIGAGKMGELTLKHLTELKPRRVLVTNRSPDKAKSVARTCGGEAVPWEQLDDVLARADIVLSTTGAPERLVTRERYERIAARRTGGAVVILDIAVPLQFDPAIHDGDQTCLFNMDDLQRIREATLADRAKHIAPAEAIVTAETQKFLKKWANGRNGAVLARLHEYVDAKRQEIVQEVLAKLNGKLSASERTYVEKSFQLFASRILHGPMTALREESRSETASGGHTLLEALRKLFRLEE